jgi:hypothetical protein
MFKAAGRLDLWPAACFQSFIRGHHIHMALFERRAREKEKLATDICWRHVAHANRLTESHACREFACGVQVAAEDDGMDKENDLQRRRRADDRVMCSRPPIEGASSAYYYVRGAAELLLWLSSSTRALAACSS